MLFVGGPAVDRYGPRAVAVTCAAFAVAATLPGLAALAARADPRAGHGRRRLRRARRRHQRERRADRGRDRAAPDAARARPLLGRDPRRRRRRRASPAARASGARRSCSPSRLAVGGPRPCSSTRRPCARRSTGATARPADRARAAPDRARRRSRRSSSRAGSRAGARSSSSGSSTPSPPSAASARASSAARWPPAASSARRRGSATGRCSPAARRSRPPAARSPRQRRTRPSRSSASRSAGAGISLNAPIVFGAGGRRGASAVATVTTLGYVGLLIGPPLVGGLAQAFSLRVSLARARRGRGRRGGGRDPAATRLGGDGLERLARRPPPDRERGERAERDDRSADVDGRRSCPSTNAPPLE